LNWKFEYHETKKAVLPHQRVGCIRSIDDIKLTEVISKYILDLISSWKEEDGKLRINPKNKISNII
jgi:hypothetical protein